MTQDSSILIAKSVKAFWLSFLIYGAAVPLGAIAATAQIQDTSTPEVSPEASAVRRGDAPVPAPPDAAPAAVKVETPPIAEIDPETNSAADRAEAENETAWVDRAEAENETAWVDRAEAENETPGVDRALPQQDIAADPQITGAIRELPPQKLEIANSPQSQQVAEASKVGEIDSDTGSADDLSIKEDAAQVTSVSQLSDVQPTDWAFGALQSLVERYGCIAGYPDGTFRGNRAMTRYEFAAGLNACLDRITQQIGSSTANLVKREDLAALQRLQEEFAAELATLRGRVDALEARTAELEANQFSTTTKLNGYAWFNLTGAFAGDKVRVESTRNVAPLDRVGGRDPVTNRPIVQRVDDPEITFSQLVWLTLNTSFTGKDQLITQIAVGNGNSPANQFTSAGLFNTFGTPFLDQTAGGNPNEVILRELSYRFPVSDSLQVVVGPRINFYRYFDNNNFNFFVDGSSSFNSNNSPLLSATRRGAGALVLWDIGRRLKLRFGYLGESTEFLPTSVFNSASNPSQGLFGGTNTTTAELTFSPSDRANLRFLYSRSNIQQIGGLIGSPNGKPINGLADDGFGGRLGDATANTFSFNFDWSVTRRFGLFGRYGYAETNIFPKTNRPDGTIETRSYQLGVAFPDLFKEGALFTVSFLVPFDITGGRRFLVSGGGNGGTQHEIEATYYLPLTENISIVPAFYAIFNANNFDSNPTIFVGNLRTQFSF